MSATTLKQLDPTQVELEIAISPEEFDAATDAAFKKLSRSAKVPGFRPGKVPRKIFEQQYGTAMIVDRAMEDLVPVKYSQAVDEHKIEPVARPTMELLPEADGAPLRFKAVVSIRPAIDVKDYQGVEIEQQPDAATDEELENALESMRKDAATLVPANRAVKLGDIATLDYEGKIDGVPFEGGTAKGEQTEIAESRFIPGFAAGIVGMQAGDVKDVHATFPEDYGAKELAGKHAIFSITVHEVKEPELPALDDEFAKRVSKSQTLDELRAELRARLDAATLQRGRREMSQALIDKLLTTHDFALPQILVEREIDSLINDSQQYVARFGSSWDDYLQAVGKTEEQFRADYKEEADKRVKTTLLIEAIAKAEGVSATPADIEVELESLSRQYNQPREKILELLGANVGALVDGIVRTKTIDFLIERAKVVPAATKPSGT
ncbi:MAG: trigger factor [Candidatus Velthaea sp.]